VESMKLLRNTDLKIYEIANLVGYSDADYFITRFEKINHISPSKYKRNLTGKEE